MKKHQLFKVICVLFMIIGSFVIPSCTKNKVVHNIEVKGIAFKNVRPSSLLTIQYCSEENPDKVITRDTNWEHIAVSAVDYSYKIGSKYFIIPEHATICYEFR